MTVHHYWPYSPWAASGDVDGSLKPVQGRFSNHDAQPKTPPTIIWPKIIIIHQYFPEIAGRGFPLLTQLPFWGKKRPLTSLVTPCAVLKIFEAELWDPRRQVVEWLKSKRFFLGQEKVLGCPAGN